MRVFTSSLRIIGLTLCLAAGGVAAETLPLPEPLVSLNSDQGARLLLESEANRAYWPLSIQFVTQKNQAYCGVASLVMVLNALGVPPPSTPEFEPFKTSSVFDSTAQNPAWLGEEPERLRALMPI